MMFVGDACERHPQTAFVPSQCDWSDEPFCPDCDTEQSYSDLYKDEVGVRPHFDVSLATMREFVEDHTA